MAKLTLKILRCDFKGLPDFVSTFKWAYLLEANTRKSISVRCREKAQIYNQIYHVLMKNYQDHNHHCMMKECLRALRTLVPNVLLRLTSSSNLRIFVLHVSLCPRALRALIPTLNIISQPKKVSKESLEKLRGRVLSK